MTLQFFALGVIGAILAVFVLAGIVYATVVLIGETRGYLRTARARRAKDEAVRRYRVPTQR